MNKQSPPHDFKIFSRSGFVFASCPCGWVGPKRTLRYDAEQDGEDHAIYASRSRVGGRREGRILETQTYPKDPKDSS